MNENRKFHSVLPNGLKVYRVKLVGGPCNGLESLASHDTVFCHGQEYKRGLDDRYYHLPEKIYSEDKRR